MPGTATLTINSTQWQVSVATTPSELTQGLGGLPSIPANTGMLFDLGYETIITVTTEPMLFPLDIAFISSSLVVVDIARNVQPDCLITSDVPARYFLEVNAGELSGVAIGDAVVIQGAQVQPNWTSNLMSFGMAAMMIGLAGAVVVGMVRSNPGNPVRKEELLREPKPCKICGRLFPSSEMIYHFDKTYTCKECYAKEQQRRGEEQADFRQRKLTFKEEELRGRLISKYNDQISRLEHDRDYFRAMASKERKWAVENGTPYLRAFWSKQANLSESQAEGFEAEVKKLRQGIDKIMDPESWQHIPSDEPITYERWQKIAGGNPRPRRWTELTAGESVSLPEAKKIIFIGSCKVSEGHCLTHGYSVGPTIRCSQSPLTDEEWKATWELAETAWPEGMHNPWVNGWWPETLEEAERTVENYARSMRDAVRKYREIQWKAMVQYETAADKAIYNYRQYVLREYERRPKEAIKALT